MGKKILLWVVFSCCASFLWAQQEKIYFVADLLEYDETQRNGAELYTGNVIFNHQKTIGYCDTALHFRSENQLHAFGRPIRIEVNDSVTIYGEFLVYDGNTRTVSIAKNVVLKDKNANLFTDSLIYDLNTDLGYYITGGFIVSGTDTLTSRVGYYNTTTDIADLYDSVRLINETYLGESQSASYNTRSDIVYFTSRTHLYSEENELFSDRGWYDTQHELATLYGNSELYNDGQNLFGDSLYFDNQRGLGRGWNNVQLVDTIKNYILQGNYMEYLDQDYAIVTDSTLMILIDGNDSLYLHADTIRILFDTAQAPKHFFAYNHVKFFREDMQGACDSMVYHIDDSLITMYYNPVVWTENNQLTGDTIHFNIIDSVSLTLQLCRSAFIVASVYDEVEFNQVKGRDIVGNIRNNELTRVEVIGNAECLYYVQEEDSSLIGINSALTSEMSILFESNEIQSIIFYNAPDGKIYPDAALDPKERLLKNFRWLKRYRPTTRTDIYYLPVERSPITQQTNSE